MLFFLCELKEKEASLALNDKEVNNKRQVRH
jgi:hypothetical protein